MKTYKIQDREAGNVIDKGLSYTDALLAIKDYEAIDRVEDTYTPDFYEIKPMYDKGDIMYAKDRDMAYRYFATNGDHALQCKDRFTSCQCDCGESDCIEYWTPDWNTMELRIIICEACYKTALSHDKCII